MVLAQIFVPDAGVTGEAARHRNVSPVSDPSIPAQRDASSRPTRLYAASTAAVPNPDRGFYHHTETHARDDDSGSVPLDAERTGRWRTEEGVTLVHRTFYLERFVATDTIDRRFLASVAADLAAARGAGVKLVVRFAYSADSSRDAPVDRVVRHIGQLAPVLGADADVISALQAGFIGRWGEWYYTDSFSSDPSRPWMLTEADWQARSAVLTTLLDATDATVPVQVRYPGIAQRILGSDSSAGAARVGIHDDCFLAGTDDSGTFRSEADRAWLAERTRSVVLGGETCSVNPPRSEWPSARRELAAYHWTFLNADYHPDVLASWGTEGRAEAGRCLGYRLVLTESAAPTSSAPGAPVVLDLTLRNDGYAAVLRERAAYLVLHSAAATSVVRLPLDVRAVAPGATVTFSATVAAPAASGTYDLALWLPDPSPRLSADPAYAIRLANVGTWDPSTGRNSLCRGIAVTEPMTSASSRDSTGTPTRPPSSL